MLNEKEKLLKKKLKIYRSRFPWNLTENEGENCLSQSSQLGIGIFSQKLFEDSNPLDKYFTKLDLKWDTI